MNFSDFKEYTYTHITDYLPPVKDGWILQFKKIEKTNESYTGLIVKQKNMKLFPSVNLDDAYMLYCNGQTAESLMKKMADIVTSALPVLPPDIRNYEEIRERLLLRVSGENGREAAKNAPAKYFEDLVLTVSIVFDADAEQIGSIMVTNELLKIFGISEAQLFKDAEESSRKNFPESFMTLREIIMELSGEDPGEDEKRKMYMLTNSRRVFGASVLFYDGEMEAVASRTGGDYYIIPSSVHEIIIVPAEDAASLQAMKRKVKAANSCFVEPGDVLSDNVYFYDSSSHRFSIAQNTGDH